MSHEGLKVSHEGLKVSNEGLKVSNFTDQKITYTCLMFRKIEECLCEVQSLLFGS